jgi:hypothetical protein
MGGDVWRFNTRQFRRTLARYIANRPFDDVHMNRRDDRVGRLELTVAHTGNRIVCQDADIGMMIASHAGHCDRHVDRLVPRHASD